MFKLSDEKALKKLKRFLSSGVIKAEGRRQRAYYKVPSRLSWRLGPIPSVGTGIRKRNYLTQRRRERRGNDTFCVRKKNLIFSL
jgi:hypothetical protein